MTFEVGPRFYNLMLVLGGYYISGILLRVIYMFLVEHFKKPDVQEIRQTYREEIEEEKEMGVV